MTRKRPQSERLFADRGGSRRGRTRRAADVTIGAWRAAGRLELADELVVGLLRRSADLVDEAAADPDESRFVRQAVLGRALDVARFAYGRIAPDDDGPDLAELLAGLVDTAHPPPD